MCLRLQPWLMGDVFPSPGFKEFMDHGLVKSSNSLQTFFWCGPIIQIYPNIPCNLHSMTFFFWRFIFLILQYVSLILLASAARQCYLIWRNNSPLNLRACHTCIPCRPPSTNIFSAPQGPGKASTESHHEGTQQLVPFLPESLYSEALDCQCQWCQCWLLEKNKTIAC